MTRSKPHRCRQGQKPGCRAPDRLGCRLPAAQHRCRTHRWSSGVAGRPVARRHRRRTTGHRQHAAGQPGVGGRPERLPRRGHRGVPAAHRRRAPRRAGTSGHRSSSPDRRSVPAGTRTDTGPLAGAPSREASLRSAMFADPVDNSMFDRLRATPARIDLTPGAPDLAAFPRAGWLRAERVGAVRARRRCLRLPGPAGAHRLPPFRRRLAGPQPRDDRRAGRCGDRRAGVAQALALLARVLRGCTASAGSRSRTPGRGARGSSCRTGASTPRRSPVDDDGLRVDRPADAGAPAVLLTPAHQFPTGVVLDGARRRELLAWAADGGLIIEDDYDAEHRYDRPPTPALHHARPTRSATRAACPNCWRRRCGWAGWWSRRGSGRR